MLMFQKTCKYCNVEFTSKTANMGYCGTECKIIFLKKNSKCSIHENAGESDFRIRRQTSYPQAVCKICERDRKKTPKGREAGRARKRRVRALYSEDKKQEILDKEKQRAKKRHAELWDGYIKECLINKTNLSSENIPKEMIEVKRLEIMIKRLIKGSGKGRYKIQ